MPDPYAQKGLKHLRIPLARQLAVCAAQITQSEPSCMSCASTSIFDAPQSRDVPSKERVADAFRVPRLSSDAARQCSLASCAAADRA